jgi:hypothetical protein
MDLSWLDDTSARLWMMQVDLVTGVALAMRPGISRVIAAGYALTVPLYFPQISGLFTRAEPDFTVVYIVNVLQIGALFIGTLGGHGGGGGNRRVAWRIPMAAQGGNRGIPDGAISGTSARDGVSE